MPSVELSKIERSRPAARPAATAETTPPEAPWAELAARLEGPLVLPDDGEYDSARRVWNGTIDRYPAAIARCASTADAAAGIAFAREHGVLLAVRGGGHSIPGHSVCDGGLVLDLSPLDGVEVDAERRVARAQPGATWGILDAATAELDLATTGGQVATTGIAGLTLGGGLGLLMRKHGLTCDNLLATELVTAEGDLVRASEDENPELFWALRGGGGNFGVVTSFEYRLYPSEPIFGGFLVHDASRAGAVLRHWRDFVEEAPDALFSEAVVFRAPPEPPFPDELHGKPVVSIGPYWIGDQEEGERVLEPLRRFGPPDAELLWPMPYVHAQTIFTAPAGRLRYEKSDFLPELTDDAIDALLAASAGTDDSLSQIVLVHMGGAVARIDPLATAFRHRDTRFFLTASTCWSEPGEGPARVAWARNVWEAARPWSRGVYVNFLDEDDDEDRLASAYGADTYARLVRVKDHWDPENLFRLNQNIKPSAEADRPREENP